MESTLSVKHYWISALRSHIFEYLRETFYRHALEYLLCGLTQSFLRIFAWNFLQTCLGVPAVEPARSEKKRKKKKFLRTETTDY